MNKHFLLIFALAAAALVSCKPKPATPRPTIELVHSILADTSGLRTLAAQAGSVGASGSIAIVGDPTDAILLARRFQAVDLRDNVDGRMQRDSLPDFAGECIDAILDVFHAPYSHFAGEYCSLDSLREVTVQGALFAWDSTCCRHATDRKRTQPKQQAKILIYTSSLQAGFGLFDVDTLQQLTGGQCLVLSPVDILLGQVLDAGASSVAVWTSREARQSRVWEDAFEARRNGNQTLTALTPDQALDVRTRFRNILRQYQATGLSLDALIIDSYTENIGPLRSELAMIRRAGTDEDAAFDRMLSARFNFYLPSDALIETTYGILRGQNLFAHRIARPQVKYYQTVESDRGEVVLVEASSSYVYDAYVPEFD